MENAEEILQSLDEFSKMKPKDIPRELEEYLCFVAKTGDPVYQWPLIKCLFREKLINVITDFYESCPSVDIPPCPNVAAFNYDAMKNFILEKLDTFAAAPFTVQRICELLTTPRKEYNRIDKYMRALEKNILVVSTREPGNRKSTENGENVVNGLESEHVSQEMINSDINVEVEMDEASSWQKTETTVPYAVNETNIILESQTVHASETVQDTYISDSKNSDSAACSSSISTVITSRPIGYIGYTPNITDLIIEPSAMTADSEPGSAPTQNGEPSSDNGNINLFTMGTEPTLATDPSEELKEEDAAYTKNVEHVDSVFAKADCSESAYLRLEQDEPQIQIDAEAEKKDDIIMESTTEEVETSEGTVEAEPSVSHVDQQEVNDSEEIVPATVEVSTEEQPEPSSPAADTGVASPPAETSSVVEPEPSIAQPESSEESVTENDQTPVEETTETSETTITSTEEVPTSASTEPSEPVETNPPDIVQTSSENQVSESNLSSEFTESQSEATEAPTEEETATDGSSMEVDDAAPNTTEAEPVVMETN